MSKRKPRVIDLLRTRYLGEWKYLGAGEWEGDGMMVFAVRCAGGRMKYFIQNLQAGDLSPRRLDLPLRVVSR